MKLAKWGLLGLGAALLGGWLGWHAYERWKPRRDTPGQPHPYSKGWE